MTVKVDLNLKLQVVPIQTPSLCPTQVEEKTGLGQWEEAGKGWNVNVTLLVFLLTLGLQSLHCNN